MKEHRDILRILRRKHEEVNGGRDNDGRFELAAQAP